MLQNKIQNNILHSEKNLCYDMQVFNELWKADK